MKCDGVKNQFKLEINWNNEFNYKKNSELKKISKNNILIVDDDSNNRETLAVILEDNGYVVDQVGLSKDALKQISQKKFEIVLIDINMPDMNGITLLKKIKKINDKIACIIITGYASADNAIEAIQNGAKGFFVKPIIIEEIIFRVKELLKIEELQTELRESEEKYKVLVEDSPNYVLIVQDNVIKYANKTLCDKSGWSYEEITDRSFDLIKNLVHPDEQNKIKDMMVQRLNGKEIYPYSAKFVKRDGEIIEGIISGKIIQYKGKRAIEYIINDNTALKKLEREIKSSENIHKTIFDNVNDAIFVVDVKDYTIKTANNKIINLMKTSDKEVIGKTCYSVTHNRSSVCEEPNDMCPVKEMIKTGKAVTYEHTHFDKDGKPFFVEVSASPIRDENGQIVQAVHVAKNIDERKKMLNTLKESEERFRSMIRSATDAIISGDENGIIVSWNKSAEEMFGYTNVEAYGKNLSVIMPKRFQEKHTKAFVRYVNTGKEHIIGKTVEVIGRKKDGTEFPIDLSLSTWMVGDKKYFGAIIRDVTEKKNRLEILEKTVLERTDEIRKINSEISQKFEEKIEQINRISLLKEKLAEISEVDDKMSKIFDEVIKDLKQDIAFFMVIDEIKQKSEIKYVKSIKDIKINRNITWNQIKKSCLVNPIPKSFLNENHICVDNAKSVHCAPVFLEGKIVGIFVLASMGDEILSNENLAILNLYSGLVSSVLEKRKLSIEPVKEMNIIKRSKYSLESGNAYAFVDKIDLAYNIFSDQVMSGSEGLCISRIFPKKIRELYGIQKTPIMWLNEQNNDKYDTISSLSDCAIIISDYLKKAVKPIILLDGIEYLIANNGFNQVLRFIQSRRSLIESTDSILLVPFDSQAIDKKENQLLLRELSIFKKNILSN